MLYALLRKRNVSTTESTSMWLTTDFAQCQPFPIPAGYCDLSVNQAYGTRPLYCCGPGFEWAFALSDAEPEPGPMPTDLSAVQAALRCLRVSLAQLEFCQIVYNFLKVHLASGAASAQT